MDRENSSRRKIGRTPRDARMRRPASRVTGNAAYSANDRHDGDDALRRQGTTRPVHRQSSATTAGEQRAGVSTRRTVLRPARHVLRSGEIRRPCEYLPIHALATEPDQRMSVLSGPHSDSGRGSRYRTMPSRNLPEQLLLAWEKTRSERCTHDYLRTPSKPAMPGVYCRHSAPWLGSEVLHTGRRAIA